jgi:hypothetical protein
LGNAGLSKLIDRGEGILPYPAEGAYPAIGDILKGGSGFYASVRVSLGGIVNITANGTHIFFHTYSYRFQLVVIEPSVRKLRFTGFGSHTEFWNKLIIQITLGGFNVQIRGGAGEGFGLAVEYEIHFHIDKVEPFR